MQRRGLFVLAVSALVAPAAAQGLPRRINHNGGVALRGYDPVAWFANGGPRRGSPLLMAQHGGVAWHFASEQNLEAFRASADGFLPAFGGFCAFGVSRGYKVDIDPEAWHIRDGRLFLNYDRGVQRQWQRDIPGHIARAEANWPRLADT